MSCCGAGEFGEAVAVVERNGDALERLISHEFALDRGARGDALRDRNPAEVMKVMIGALAAG